MSTDKKHAPKVVSTTLGEPTHGPKTTVEKHSERRAENPQHPERVALDPSVETGMGDEGTKNESGTKKRASERPAMDVEVTPLPELEADVSATHTRAAKKIERGEELTDEELDAATTPTITEDEKRAALENPAAVQGSVVKTGAAVNPLFNSGGVDYSQFGPLATAERGSNETVECKVWPHGAYMRSGAVYPPGSTVHATRQQIIEHTQPDGSRVLIPKDELKS